MAPPKGFLELVKPVGVKGDASAIDDTQSSMLESLASGDISGSLSSGDKLIALGALLKSVSRGSKTTPQEVMQNLQASKLQEMQNKIQLQQLRAAREKDARVKAITGAGVPTAGGEMSVNDPEYYYAKADQLAREGETTLAEAYRKQGDSIAQYTGGGRLVTEYAAKLVNDAFSVEEGLDPATNRPFKLPKWQARGYSSPMAYIQANTPGGLAARAAPTGAPAPMEGGTPTIPTQVGGRTYEVPAMSPPVAVPGLGVTGLSEGEKVTTAARGEQFKALITDAQQRALTAQRRLPQTQALDMLAEAIGTGKTAEFRNAANSWLDAFGLSNDPRAKAALANAAAFTDLRKQITLNNLQSLSGPSSDRDVVFGGQIGPLMTNSPAGNRLINATQSALDRRDIAFNNFLGRYKGEPGQALEAWGKTKIGRLGILGDPEYVTAAAKTGLIRVGEAKDKSGRTRLFVVARGKPLSSAIYLN